MTDPPCGIESCPVRTPEPALVRRIHTVTIEPGTRTWFRGSNIAHAGDGLNPGIGDTRFAPLPDTRHAYIGATRTVAILESALHEAAGPRPTIYAATLGHHQVTPVALAEPLRLADLRDPELARLGIERTALVNTSAAHYPCTRAWAQRLQTHRPGGHQVHGLLWHSRQADLHAQAHAGSLVADLVAHQPAEVAVLWHPHGPATPLRTAGPPILLAKDRRVTRLVIELSALLGAPIE